MPSYLIDRSGAAEVELDRARLEQLRDGEGFWWLDIHEPTDEELALLGEVLALHELAIEDAMQLRSAPQARRVRRLRVPRRLRRGARRGRRRRGALLLLGALSRDRAARSVPRVRRGARALRPAAGAARGAGPRPLPRRRQPGRQLLPAPLRRGQLHRRGRGGDLHPPRPGAAATGVSHEAAAGRPAQGDRAATRPRRQPRRRSGRAARHVAGRRTRLSRRLRPPHPPHRHDRRLPRPAHRRDATRTSRPSQTG